ncbi:PaaI family thioesterase [Pontixanthobacter aquaemixtae]|uniref:Hotdog fold thioesterase n=1 Tax=Pontixanthobacter aquaemixtae TaxID=1958940 RepID=A0A844ZXP9_9SPHN|nr:PaaI family thioesterase [Pontixanthobacter aquaemixtae]MXO91527.1 hotdog fold thioesterase [Pontixanthobacter aquaemixtae]
MAVSRFESPEASIAYMKEVAVGRSGFSNWLQVEPVTVWEGQSELLLELRPEMTQHHGFAHGAIVGLMADNACAWAAASVVGDVVTGSYTINFLAPAIGSRLRSKGAVIKSGKRQVVVRAEVWSESEDGVEKLVASAQGTIVPTGQIEQER